MALSPVALAQQILSAVDLAAGSGVHAKAVCKAIGKLSLISVAVQPLA